MLVKKHKTKQLLAQSAGNCRFVYNYFRNRIIEDYNDYIFCKNSTLANGGDINELNFINNFDYNPYKKASAFLPQLKEEFEFLKLSSATSQQMVVNNLAQAFVDFKSNKKGFVKAKKKDINSFSFNQNIKIDYINSRIFIPKIGFIRFKKSREILGTPFNVTITKHCNKWLVSIQTKKPLSTINPIDLGFTKDNMVGIDLGIKKIIAITSNLEFEFQGKTVNTANINTIDVYKDNYIKLALLQRKLAKKQVGSKNFIKNKKKISKLNSHIANIRTDFLHKLSTAIVNKHPYIAVEDLKIKNMSKSAKGTKIKSGKNVKAKQGLNREILRQGWGIFLTFLEYKLKYNYGVELHKVNPKNTSRKCSQCGYTHKHNRKSQAKFKCLMCGFKCNADDNAALNIKADGLAATDCIDELGLTCVSKKKRKVKPNLNNRQ